MEILAVEPVSEVKRVEPRLESKQVKKQTTPSASFAEILQQVQQGELASKVASSTFSASMPSSIKVQGLGTLGHNSTPNTSLLSQASSTRLNGDYLSSFKLENPTEADKTADPQGNARASLLAKGQTIDKTSKLYEQSLELESYFVKILIDSMKNTLQGSLLGDESYASKMYRDMMFEELSRTMTKNAGFGLADQIYLELNS